MSGITGFSWRKGGGLLSRLGEKPPTKAAKKKPKKKRKRHSMREWQYSQLHAIIDAEIKHKVPPNLPRKWQEKFAELANSYGGVSAWARAQPDYESLKEKKMRKLIRKRAVSLEGS